MKASDPYSVGVAFRPGYWVKCLDMVADIQARIRLLQTLRTPGGANSHIDQAIAVERGRLNGKREHLAQIVWW